MDNKNTPNRISKTVYRFGNEVINVKVVRDSKICRLLSDEDHITIGHTIYVRGKFLVQRTLRNGLNEMTCTPRWIRVLLNTMMM